MDSEYVDAECGDSDDISFFEADEQTHEDERYNIMTDIRERLQQQSLQQQQCTSTTTTPPAAATAAATSTSDESTSIPKSESFVESVKDLSDSAESVQMSAENSVAASSEAVDGGFQHDPVWRAQKKHIFVLSDAGKPIYTLHGSEEKQVELFGLMQALVSVVQNEQDAITSIHARGIKFVFLLRGPLILVAASRTNMSVQQLQMQLSDVYNQILSTVTYDNIMKNFKRRKNFDLRRLLEGSERLINNIFANDSTNKRITNNVFTFLTNSIRVMPLPTAVRSNIESAIKSNCSKIKNLVFAILIADNKLISLVRMKYYAIHHADLRLLFNLIECSESLKSFENWTPICLPKFNMNCYLYTHVSYLADDCQACLLLLSTDRDDFEVLSDAKKRITDKLRRTHCLEAINDEINKHVNARVNFQTIGIPELRHFLYKPRSIAQLLCSEITIPYTTLPEFERLESIYYDLLHRVHNTARPLKLIYEVKEREMTLAWVTAAYELYAVFEPMVEKNAVIKNIDKLIKWIDKEYDVYFIRKHPNF